MTQYSTDERGSQGVGASSGPGSQGVAPQPLAASSPDGAVPSRVLFLDIDGVVLNGRALWHTGNNKYLPPEKIALVREVCDRARCVIVVSSAWRYSDATADMLCHAGLTLHPDWRTPWSKDMVGSIIQGQQRGVEIGRWLARHPDTQFAIVDDDSDMLFEQMPYFVKTDHEDGIEPWHVEALVNIFRDRDASLAEDAKRLSGEAVAARAEGIANV